MAQAAERRKMDVANPAPWERRTQRLGVELRVVARARDGPNVGEDRDPVGSKEIDQLAQCPGGMADGEEANPSPVIGTSSLGCRASRWLEPIHRRPCPSAPRKDRGALGQQAPWTRACLRPNSSGR